MRHALRLLAVAGAFSLFTSIPAGAQSAQPAASATSAAIRPPALHVARGSIAHRDVVAIGRDARIDGEARASVAVVRGSARISGVVAGSVIVLDGDIELESLARVRGDVYAVGGGIAAAPGAVVEGRSAAYPTASAAWLTLLEGPSLGLSATSRPVLTAKFALLAAWAVILLLGFSFRGREAVATSQSVRREPLQNFVLGLACVLTLALTVALLSAALHWLLSVPILALVVVAALALKLWGLLAVFHALGAALVARWRSRRWLAIQTATVGLLMLGAIKLVPWLGTIVWTLATLIGIGAALATKFGRNEPWFLEPVGSG
jgi:hypothetical protein